MFSPLGPAEISNVVCLAIPLLLGLLLIVAVLDAGSTLKRIDRRLSRIENRMGGAVGADAEEPLHLSSDSDATTDQSDG